MKKNIIFALIIAVTIFSVPSLISQRPIAIATSAFVSDMYVDSGDSSGTDSHIRLCWYDAADTNRTPIVKYYEGTSTIAQTGILSNTWLTPLVENEVTVGYRHCTNVTKLKDNTKYSFQVVFENSTTSGTTSLYPDLSGYSDYQSSTNKVVSSKFSFRTAKADLIVRTVDKSYLLPGERVKVYFDNLGSQQVTSAYLGPLTYDFGTHEGDYYTFDVISSGANYIEFEAPAYDATKDVQLGSLYFNAISPVEGNYKYQAWIRMIQSADDIQKSTASGYEGDKYRYLLNSSIYRYGSLRTDASSGIEGERMIWVKNYLQSISKGIDATWAIALAYTMTYGGYNENEVKHEIQFGPGCVHIYLPQATWSQTTDYAQCMSNSI